MKDSDQQVRNAMNVITASLFMDSAVRRHAAIMSRWSSRVPAPNTVHGEHEPVNIVRTEDVSDIEEIISSLEKVTEAYTGMLAMLKFPDRVKT